MSILVVFTGGTIGSVAQSGWIAPNESANYTLLESYAQRTGRTEDFLTCAPYTILSENLDAASLNKLLACVDENLSKNLEGIIVTHGTDTLQYSACALELAFRDAELPIVVVSSDFPLDDERANGHANFQAAVAYVKQKRGTGVRVAYRNTASEQVAIHFPLHLLEHNDASGNLTCLGAPEYLYDPATDSFTVPEGFRHDRVRNSDFPRCLVYAEDPQVTVITSRPGARYDCDWNATKAVFITAYHSGTLDTNNQNLVNFCLKAREHDIPVFIVGQKDGDQYASTKEYLKFRLCHLPACTLISAYMKAWAAVSTSAPLSYSLLVCVSNEYAF